MRFYPTFLLVTPLLAFSIPTSQALPASLPKIVEFSARLSYVQGDVRVSPGVQGEPRIDKDWVEVTSGMKVDQGYSVATQDGSAEIELENGSIIYLAPYSVLMFYDLNSSERARQEPEEFDEAGVKLLTGTVLFLSEFRSDGEFILETQTLRVRTDHPALFRVTSYLNSTEVVNLNPNVPPELLGLGFPSRAVPGTYFDGKLIVKAPESVPDHGWDAQARERVEEHQSLTLAAMRDGGFDAPFSGLLDLYGNGTFSACGERDTCWEPSRAALAELSAQNEQTPTSGAQVSQPNQRQVLSESDDWVSDGCSSVWAHTTIWRDANGKMRRERRPATAPPAATKKMPWPYAACTTGEIIYPGRIKFRHHHHHHHYHATMKWVKVNGRVGVARTIRNANGKVGIDRSAVYLRSDRPEEALKHAEISATTKIATLGRAPTEFRGSEVRDALKVSPPVITGQFREAHEIALPRLAPRVVSTLHEATYDYKAHGFSMSRDLGAAREVHPVIVARMNSFGGVYAPSGNSAGAGAVHGLPSAGHMAAASYGTSGGGVSGTASGHSGGGSGASSSAASATVSAGGHPH